MSTREWFAASLLEPSAEVARRGHKKVILSCRIQAESFDV